MYTVVKKYIGSEIAFRYKRGLFAILIRENMTETEKRILYEIGHPAIRKIKKEDKK